MMLLTEPPSVPESVSLTPQQTSITVRWSPPTEDGGRTDLYYEVEHSDPDNLRLYTGPVYLSGVSRTHTFSGLRPFTPYCVRVTAHNGVSDQDPDGTHLRRVEVCEKTKETGALNITSSVVCLGESVHDFLFMLLLLRAWTSTKPCQYLPNCAVARTTETKWCHRGIRADVFQERFDHNYHH